jgi:hypothetical protein
MSPFGSRSCSIDSTSSLHQYEDNKIQTIDLSLNLNYIYSKSNPKRRKREQKLTISQSPTLESFLMKMNKNI